MDSGSHVPTYLLCERFVAEGRVLDLFPPDEAGSRLLASSARMVVVVEESRTGDSGDVPQASNLVRVVAATESLPFGRGAFDLVIVPLLGSKASIEGIDERVRAVRGLLNPAGLLAVLVPNRDGFGLGDDDAQDAPAFIDFERVLRRHFPHVVLLAQQPLHGAVLSPIGRRPNRDGPLFDDRLLPGGGEAPSCFLALCSLRYRRIDEVVIARLPFAEFAAGVRGRIERLSGTIDLMLREQEAQRAASAILEQRGAELRSRLDGALLELRDKSVVETRVTELEEALRRRDRSLEEADIGRDDLQRRIDGLEQDLQSAGLEIRRLERRVHAAEETGELVAREREEQERELDRLRQELREARTEIKAKQRELDDALEQLAGTDSELASLLKEATRQRRELMAARERNRGLEQELAEKETDDARLAGLERELEQVRSAAAAERERLERRIDDERRRNVDVSGQLDAALREARDTRHAMDEILREREEAGARIADLEQRRLDIASAAEERIALLTAQGTAAEERAADLDQQLEAARREALQAGEGAAVSEAEGAEVRRLLVEVGERAAKDREELERLRPRATAVEAVRGLARAAEARAEELNGELEQARMDLFELRARLEQREQELTAAAESLARSEGAITEAQEDLTARLRELKAENRRLRHENESELVMVREDLETELRSVRRQLESRDQEIWELNEEVVRLRAHSAARAATGEISGESAGIHQTVFEQENTIAELREECQQLRFECEKRQRSLDLRKKNLKILAALLRQERARQGSSDSEPPAAPDSRGDLVAGNDVDIGKLIEGALDDFDEIDEALDTVRVQNTVSGGNQQDDS